MYLIDSGNATDGQDIVGFTNDEELAKKAAKWIGGTIFEILEVVACYTAYYCFKDNARGLVVRSNHTLTEPVEFYKDGSATAASPTRAVELYMENNPDVFK